MAFDNFMDLSVSFPRRGVRITGYISLEDCLKNFIKAEQMDECGYKCTKCKKVDHFTKDMTLFKFPTILVIHLKRFYNSYMRREKINTSVEIPNRLDMTPYAPYLDSKQKSRVRPYKLFGMSHHSGTLYGGHYIG